MQSIIWGGASIAFTVVFSLVLLFLEIDIGDVMYAMLSGSIVGLVFATCALTKDVAPHQAVLLLFTAIVAAAAGWFLGFFLLKLFTMQIYSITALAFDLIVGICGSLTACAILYSRFCEAPVMAEPKE